MMNNKEISFYVQILAQVPGLLVVMNHRSEFIFSNDATAELFGYNNAEAMLGITALDMRCPAVESANTFLKQDAWVRDHAHTLTLLDIHTYADGQAKILLTKKSPFLYNNESTGTICFCTEVSSASLLKLSAFLIDSGKSYNNNRSRYSQSYTIGDIIAPSVKLTPREQDCLYYMLRGQSSKEVATSLSLSPRTVETHKENIKRKWQCHTHSQIIERALHEGYLNHIPQRIFQESHSLAI